MRTVTVPTIFTAVDKFSTPVTRMGASMVAFSSKAEAGIARSERMFRKLTPAVSETQKQLLSYASSAAIAGGVISGIVFSVNSIKQYDDALASFKTIVGDTNGSFAEFQKTAIEVAAATKSSSVDVVKSFESIAGLNADLAKTPKILGEVTKAAILMSQGSGDDLQKSSENLVGILNQFNMEGNEASRVINVLAAGQAVGASSITKTADAFTVFGSVAKGANISVEQATGLVQVLGRKMILGSEAGTALKATIGLLQKSGFGYKKGLFDINEALETAKQKYDQLATAKQKDAFIAKTFGEVNKSTGTVLLSNIQLYKEFTAGVTDTSEAQKAADIKTQTLSASLEQLKNAWITMVTGSDAAGQGLNDVKRIIGFVTKNLGTIVSVGAKVLALFVAWKAIMVASKVALVAYNVVLGINSALQGESAFVTAGNTVAYNAYRATVVTTTPALAAMTTAQASLNAMMLANPVGAFIVLLAALTVAIMAAVNAYLELEKVERRRFEQKQAKKQESFSIQDKVAANYAKGNSLPEAKRLAMKESMQNTLTQIKEQRALLDNPATAAAAEEKLNTLYGKANAVLSGKALTESGPRYANTKELGSYVAPIAGSGSNMSAPDWTNMPTQKMEITLNAPEGTVKGVDTKNAKNVSVIPKTKLTMESRK